MICHGVKSLFFFFFQRQGQGSGSASPAHAGIDQVLLGSAEGRELAPHPSLAGDGAKATYPMGIKSERGTCLR